MSRLRALLAARAPVVAPFVFDALQARLAEAAGFPAVYMTGFGTAAARGYPDVGLLGMSEMVANLRAITAAVGVPVVADADTGYGGVLNLRRTVREYEDAGAAALHIEDQAWPKRCGFLTGKRLIGLEEMVVRVRAACAARRTPDLVLIARTDALGPLGWEEAERRARAYRAAGADLVFVDGIRTIEDLRRYAEVLADVPKLYSGILPVDAVAPLGFELMMPLGTMLAAYGAVRDAMRELRDTGAVARGGDLATLDEMLAVLGLHELRAFEDTHA